MMEMDLRIITRTADGIPVIQLSGEVDAYTCSMLRDAMVEVIEQGHPMIVVSMADVEYIDSSGLGTLVGGLKRASEHRGRIAVVARSGQIRKVFEITGLEKVFPLFDTEKDATAAMAELKISTH
jgi:anti-sigma B factor antagonist